MPESTQYTFTHQEIVEILVRKTGIKEGKWQLMVTFGLAAANIGPDDQHLDPVGMILVNKIGIQKVPDPNQSLTNLIVDAEQLS